MEKTMALRIVVTKSGELFVAQCLEYDICTQAPDVVQLQDRMNALIELELSSGQHIDQAPERFHKMWDSCSSSRFGDHGYKLLSAA
jgi:hypothetical protein